MRWHLKLSARALRPSAAIIDIACETLLTRIQIDCGDALPSFEERYSNMQRRRRLARAALLVAKDDDMGRLSCFLDRLDQHAAPSGTGFSKYSRGLVKLNPRC
jgi:hypothetical protein